ncbi:MAG: hypothetical protein IT434_08980 [Phycisphaerales bacterium]|jgi:hypothetical protein|nr:hypothetical protein [Phycisphaerales bacterium]
MSNLVWLALSLVTALTVTGISVVFALAVTRPAAQAAVPGNPSLPTAPLQRLAITAFFNSLVLAVTGAMIAALEGPDAYQTRDGVRLLVSMLALAAAISATVPVWIARRRSRQGHIVLDERDEQILARAPGYQAISMLVVCAAWMIALTEAFWSNGHVPIAFIGLSFWSILVVWAIALPAGLMLGYRTR